MARNKNIIIFVIVLLVIIGGFFLLNNSLKDKTATLPTEEEVMPVDTISAPDQAGGTQVFVGSVTLTQDGYVVIHRDEAGAPGATIGWSDLLVKGTHENILVSLNEEVAEGDMLWAMLHFETDGVEGFNPETDMHVDDKDGNTVMIQFRIVGQGALEEEIKL